MSDEEIIALQQEKARLEALIAQASSAESDPIIGAATGLDVPDQTGIAQLAGSALQNEILSQQQSFAESPEIFNQQNMQRQLRGGIYSKLRSEDTTLQQQNLDQGAGFFTPRDKASQIAAGLQPTITPSDYISGATEKGAPVVQTVAPIVGGYLAGRGATAGMRAVQRGMGIRSPTSGFLPSITKVAGEAVEGAVDNTVAGFIDAQTRGQEYGSVDTLTDAAVGAIFGGAVGTGRATYDTFAGPGGLLRGFAEPAAARADPRTNFNELFNIPKAIGRPAAGGSELLGETSRQAKSDKLYRGFTKDWKLADGKPVFDPEPFQTTKDVKALERQAIRVLEFDEQNGTAINTRIREISEAIPFKNSPGPTVQNAGAVRQSLGLKPAPMPTDKAVEIRDRIASRAQEVIFADRGLNVEGSDELRSVLDDAMQKISPETGGVENLLGLNSRRQEIDSMIRAELNMNNGMFTDKARVLEVVRDEIQKEMIDLDSQVRSATPMGMSSEDIPLQELFERQSLLTEFNQVNVATKEIARQEGVIGKDVDYGEGGAGGISMSQLGGAAISARPIFQSLAKDPQFSLAQKAAGDGGGSMARTLQTMDRIMVPTREAVEGSGIPSTAGMARQPQSLAVELTPYSGTTRTSSTLGLARASGIEGDVKNFLGDPQRSDSAAFQPILSPTFDQPNRPSGQVPLIPRNVQQVDDMGVKAVIAHVLPPEQAEQALLQYHRIAAQGDPYEKAMFLSTLAEIDPSMPFQKGYITGMSSEFDMGDGRPRLISQRDRLKWRQRIENSALSEAEKAHRINALNREGVVVPMDVSMEVPRTMESVNPDQRPASRIPSSGRKIE